jgi:hypothetical protein
MIRKITLLLLAFLGWFVSSQAQAVCGFDNIHQTMAAQNPAYAQMVQQNTANWSQFIQSQPNGLVLSTPMGAAYEIPVVVHIMHTGGAVGTIYNPTDAQITGMIDYLNKAYAAQWTGYPDSSSGGTYVPIRFKLAQRDPNCNATTGILRYNLGSNTQYVNNGVNSNINGNIGGLDDTTLKNFERWPPQDYYNIWIVDKIDGANGTSGTFTAGFAYFAGAGPKYDGTIMLATQAIAGQITLPHEIGHAMGLYHVFEGDAGGSTCPPTTSCASTGDQVCDTEPMKRSTFNCPTGTNACTGLAWQNTQHNFMDYSNCQDRFTPGQRTKMIFNLQFYRASLLTSLGAVPLGTNPGAPTCGAGTITSSNPSNTLNYGARNVTLNDLNYSSSGYNGDGNAVYVDKSCTQRTTLTVGGSYTLSVTTGPGVENVRVYIDYNNNGQFVATELVYSHNGTTTNETHSTTYTVPVPTVQAITTCTPLRMRVITDVSTNLVMSPCGPMTYGQIEDYSVYIKPSGTQGSVSISASPNPSCIGSAVTFTATPTNGGPNPTYKWFVNNIYTGTTGSTYTTSSIANGAVVRAQMFYTATGACYADSIFSNTITVNRTTGVTPAVSIALTSGTNPGCSGQTYVFTATPTNGGTTPTYQWYVNGTAVVGATNTTFTSSTLVNNDAVTCVLTPGNICVTPTTATSNAITISITTITPTVSIAVTGGSNPGCSGQAITFTATPANGGTNPAYQWKVNGVAVTGATNSTFTSSTLNAGDVVTVTMISNSPCAAPGGVTSNGITISFTSLTASVSIAQTGGTNPICAGKPVTFTATPVNGGTSPVYNWLVNGTPAGATGATFSTTTLANGSVVSVTMTSNNPCVTSPNVSSNTITMTVLPVDTPKVSVAITKGNNPGCQDSVLGFTAVATNAGSAPAYAWLLNGVQVATGAVYTTSTLITGDVVVARVIISGPGCRTADTVYSAPINITRYPTPSTPVISFIGNMLVSTAANVQWYGPNGLIAGATSQSYHPTQEGSYYCVAVNNGCYSAPSNNLYVSLLSVGSYNMSVVKIFPNPTSGELVLDWGTKPVTMKIEVYSTLGQVLLRDMIVNQSRKSIDLSSLASGNYYVVIRDESGEVGTAKITVAK